MKNKKLFAILTLVCFLFTLMPVAAMAEDGDVYPEGTVAVIVNGETTTTYSSLYLAMSTAKSGETVKLVDDVDLAGTEWEPVSFSGQFDGQGHTIKNLTINKPGVADTGFIKSLNGTFENVTFTNPTVTGGEDTGVLAGRAGGSAALAKNITVNGTIKVETTHSGYARAAVIVGGWAYGNYENITVDGGDKNTSYVKHTGGGDGRYVAGIVGHADDVDSYINCTVKNITLSGGWLCGGIAGPGPFDGIAEGCVVENVDINADYSGGLFGWYYGTGTIEESSVKNVTFTDGANGNGAIGGYGMDSDVTVKNVTIENVVNVNEKPLDVVHEASVSSGEDTMLYATLDDAIKAAKSGDTIKLLDDIEITSACSYELPTDVTIDGAGKKLTVAGVYHGGANAVFYSDGSLNVQNLTIVNNAATASGAAIDMSRGGSVENVTVSGSGFQWAILAGNGVTVKDCTFNDAEYGVYYESTNAITSITGTTFNGLRSVILCGEEVFSGNNINGDKGLTVYTTSATIEGNTFTGERALDILKNNITIAKNIIISGSVEIEEGMTANLSANYWGGEAPINLPDGVTVESYYANYNEETGELSNLIKLAKTISLDKTELAMTVGGEATLTVTADPTDATVTWTSSNEEVVTVTNGVVTGVKAGAATITAASGTITTSCAITVTNVAVTGVILDKTSVALTVGASETLTATVEPEDAFNKNITWTSSDESVATVADGVVTAIGAGTATITVTTEDGAKTATCTVTVSENVIAVTGVSLNQESASVKVGNIVQLTATVLPDNATDKTVTWTSSNPEVATVDETGLVTGIAKGEAVITATAGDQSATCAVSVTKSSSSYSGGGVSPTVSIDSVDNATVKVSDKYASKGEKVTITVTSEDGYYPESITVTDKNGEEITVTRVALDKWEFTMPSGKVNVDVDTAEYTKEVILMIDSTTVITNGVAVENDAAPFIVDGRTLVPIRIIVEQLGGIVEWDEATRTVTLTIDGKVLTMVIDEIIPGYDTAAIIVDGRTYVPIRYIMEAVGANVDWIEATRQVIVVK